MQIRKTYLALIAILLSPLAANADPITWTIDIDDGPIDGYPQGTFDYDADTGIYSNITILGCCIDDYSQGSVDVGNSSNMQLSLDGVIYPDSLLMVFDSPLTNHGGTISGTWYELLNSLNVSANNFTFTGDLTVSAVGVPEPGTLALLGLGLLGVAARRRKQA